MSPSDEPQQRVLPQPHAEVMTDVMAWRDHPVLHELHLAMTGHTEPARFLDSYAEAIIARHLIARGAAFRMEVETPNGRACDFEVDFEGRRLYLHVKRLKSDRPWRRKLTISSRLRYLERIRRPYLVSVRWQDHTSDGQMQRLVVRASQFIQHARVGDELVVHDDDGSEIGGVLIAAPWKGDHVSLLIGLPSGFIDETLRFRKLLRRAHRQFMPKATNVIIVCSTHLSDRADLESALLGSHIERWDAYPPQGRRVAHGRAEDGFWSGRRYEMSSVVAWFRLGADDARFQPHVWRREDGAIADETLGVIDDLLTPEG